MPTTDGTQARVVLAFHRGTESVKGATFFRSGGRVVGSREWDPKDFSDELKQGAMLAGRRPWRLRQVLGKLHRGESLEIAVLGSSVSPILAAPSATQDRHALVHWCPAKCQPSLAICWLLPSSASLREAKASVPMDH